METEQNATAEPIERLGIVGAGIMGRGIAQTALLNGVFVCLVDAFPAALNAAVDQIEISLTKLVNKGELTDLDRGEALARLVTSGDYAEMAHVALVIEAVPERLDLKLFVLESVSKVVSERAIIASNTSSIPITQLATAVTEPGRFAGVHFFNPVPRMRLVEVIRTVHTDPRVEHALLRFTSEQLGKHTVVIDDRPGFVVNALLVPYLLAAARMADTGYAAPEKIDMAMREGAGHPMGPLALIDLIGLDTLCQVADSLYTETRDPAAVVPNNIRRMVEGGRLGRKSGRGFHEYQGRG